MGRRVCHTRGSPFHVERRTSSPVPGRRPSTDRSCATMQPMSDNCRAILITGTDTGVGKTHITCALARHLRSRGQQAALVKPFETGCQPDAEDERALEKASGFKAPNAGFYRCSEPVAPMTSALLGGPAPDLQRIRETLRRVVAQHPLTLIEGAGGLFTPIARGIDFSTLAAELALELVLIAPNRLGTLSQTAACCLAARSVGLRIASIVLSDASPEQRVKGNLRSLRAMDLPAEIIPWPHDHCDAAAELSTVLNLG